MPRLTDLVRTVFPPDKVLEPEDIFASTPGLIFADDLSIAHGDREAVILYTSRRFGEIELRVADPNNESDRRLFSHYLWNAGIKLAELISDDDAAIEQKWSVRNEIVLELGAGVGLDGIVATLAGAREVVLSDYPSPVVLDNIRLNAAKALPTQYATTYRVEGYAWGELDTPFAEQYRNHFTRILAADCYWMLGEHENLAKSMLHFLSLDPEARVFAIAGFHTGRAKVAAFFDIAAEEGLVVDEIYEEDADGQRREWLKQKDGGRENPTERNKWLVVARLRRK